MPRHEPKIILFKDPDAWHKLRAGTVGASESAALFETVANDFPIGEDVDDPKEYEEDGEPVSPYSSPLALWALKTGKIQPKPSNGNNRIAWGTFLEPHIARQIAEKKGWQIRKPPGYYLHPKIARMGASLDFEIETDGSGVWRPLEIKNVADTERWKWKNAVGEWVVPGHILIQVQHQLAVTGQETAFIGVLFGGSEDRVFVVTRDEKLIAEIEGAVAEFWGYVDRDEAPETNVARDGWVIRRLHQHADPEKVLDWSDHQEAQELVSQMKQHAAEAGQHKKAADEIRTRLYEMLGDAGYAVLGEQLLTATTVEGCQVSYFREPYRVMRTGKPRGKHVGRPLAALAAESKAAALAAAAAAATALQGPPKKTGKTAGKTPAKTSKKTARPAKIAGKKTAKTKPKGKGKNRQAAASRRAGSLPAPDAAARIEA